MSILMKHPDGEKTRVVTEALVKSASWLGVTQSALSAIIGLSKTTIARMENNEFQLQEKKKHYQISLDFIELYKTLYSVVSGDQETARGWLSNYNTALRGKPIELMQSLRGLYEVITYLEYKKAAS